MKNDFKANDLVCFVVGRKDILKIESISDFDCVVESLSDYDCLTRSSLTNIRHATANEIDIGHRINGNNP